MLVAWVFLEGGGWGGGGVLGWKVEWIAITFLDLPNTNLEVWFSFIIKKLYCIWNLWDKTVFYIKYSMYGFTYLAWQKVKTNSSPVLIVELVYFLYTECASQIFINTSHQLSVNSRCVALPLNKYCWYSTQLKLLFNFNTTITNSTKVE